MSSSDRLAYTGLDEHDAHPRMGGDDDGCHDGRIGEWSRPGHGDEGGRMRPTSDREECIDLEVIGTTAYDVICMCSLSDQASRLWFGPVRYEDVMFTVHQIGKGCCVGRAAGRACRVSGYYAAAMVRWRWEGRRKWRRLRHGPRRAARWKKEDKRMASGGCGAVGWPGRAINRQVQSTGRSLHLQG